MESGNAAPGARSPVSVLFLAEPFLGEPTGEFCRANSFRRVWGVRPAVLVVKGELGPFFEPFVPPLDRLELRMATLDGDKFVGEEFRVR